MACYTKITFRRNIPNNSDGITLFVKGDRTNGYSNVDAFGVWREGKVEYPIYYDPACSENSFITGVDAKTPKNLVTSWARTNLFKKAPQDIDIRKVISWWWPGEAESYDFEIESIETDF